MNDLRSYPESVWDYLGDMPQIPARSDRDLLVARGDSRRVKIWDYFFRIRPEDVGKPLAREIEEIEVDLKLRLQEHDEIVTRLQADIQEIKDFIRRRRIKRAAIAAAALLLGAAGTLFGYLNQGAPVGMIWVCSAPLFFAGLVFAFGAFFAGGEAGQRQAQLIEELESLKEENRQMVKEAVTRTNALKQKIRELIAQIPKPPDDETVQAWLQEDLERLRQDSIEKTGMGSRLVEIDGRADQGIGMHVSNPITVMGPGELQAVEEIPPSFGQKISPDRYKHLTVRRALQTPEGARAVLHGVYYIEHILVAEDMLTTRGFFFDFISGQITSEKITEQYYKDIVSIAMTREFRSVSAGIEDQSEIHIEDTPAFTLSLASGERRTITFANQNYFLGIRESLGLSEEEARQIAWAHQADEIANEAALTLRGYLRRFKGAYQPE